MLSDFGIDPRIRVLVASFLFACATSTAPAPQVAGEWLGGTPHQLSVSIKQSGAKLVLEGRLGATGTLLSGGYGLSISGTGSIDPDSTIRFQIDGRAGRQSFQGKLLPTGVISGTLSGDRVGPSQQSDLVRHEDTVQ